MGLRKEGSRVTECTGQQVLFSIGRREVTTVFDGGSVTSDAGVLLLSGIDRELGLTRRLAAAMGDRRDPSKVRHEMEELLRQRLFQICCGYEDVNDAGTLREDPGFQVAVGRVPGERDASLASQPTLSRVEVTVRRRQLLSFSEVLTGEAIRWWQGLGRKAQRTIILDFDSTADPTHGDQQLTMFHGFYDQWQYLPLLVFDQHGVPWAAVLRPGNSHDSRGVVAVLRRLVARIRQVFPKARIVFRGDAGFACPAIYEFCEKESLSYVIGQITNGRLVRRGRPFMRKARALFEKTGQKAKLFGDFSHRAKSWTKSRRIVAKAEVLPKGENPRFVVTNLPGTPEEIYSFYVERGQTENRIKDLKRALSADRLSCHRFLSNQLRLLLHTAAYLLLFRLREKLAGTPLASAQMDTLRLKLLKLGARVQVTARRIWFHLASAHPMASVWNGLALTLARAPA
jgi:hypothetical protein